MKKKSKLIKTFSFYLDAYHYALKHGVDTHRIRKVDFRNWELEI